MNTSILTPDPTREVDTYAESEGDGPDVGLIIATGDPSDQTIDTALRTAEATGGRVCLMKWVDTHVVPRSAESRAGPVEAREQLRRVRARCLTRSGNVGVYEQLHIGSLASMVAAPEDSLGAVYYDPNRMTTGS